MSTERFDGGLHVLYVDADADAVTTVTEGLEGADSGIRVTEARDPEAAREALETEQIEGVIAADRDARLDVLSVLEAVRAVESQIPFIFYGDDESIARDVLREKETEYIPWAGKDSVVGLLADRVRTAVDKKRRLGRADALECYETLVETVGDPMYILDADGTIVMANEAMCKQLGAERSTIVGRHGSEYLGDGDFDRGTALIREILEDPDRESGRFECTVKTHDGTTAPAELHLAPLEGPDGTFDGNVGIVREISERKAYEARLERERDRWSALFENLGEPVVEATFEDDLAIVQRVNEAFQQTFGTGSEIHGESVEDHIVAPDNRETATDINRQVQRGEIVERELRRETQSGPRWFAIRTVPFEIDGEARAYAIYIDITERKERERDLEQSQELTQALSTTFPDYTFIYNADGVYLDVITGWEGATNLHSPEEIVGTHVGDLLDPDTASKIQQAIEETLATGNMQTIEYTVDTPGGLYWYEANLAPLREGYEGEEAVVMSARDISERKAYQQSIERQNARLEEFASVLSHDLRNPLGVAEGRLELAREEVDNDHLDVIARAHERMEVLIENLLAIAREGEPVSETEPVNLAKLTRSCWETVATECATLDVETDLTIRADRSRLQQLLENVFRNAIDHVGPEVTITVGACEGGFYIEDDGPGVPPEEREEIFETGYSTAEEGTGLGLSIVRDIAEAHGWEVDVTEAAHGGARFEITGVELV